MKYYIYYHVDPRDNLPKYIGKGSGNRAWEMSKGRRSRKHFNWINKLRKIGLEPGVMIGTRFDDESKSYEIEKVEIAFMRKIGIELKNITEGGDGIISTPDIIRRRAISHYKPVKCLNNNKNYPSITHCAADLDIDKRRITDVLRGRKKPYKGLKFEYLEKK